MIAITITPGATTFYGQRDRAAGLRPDDPGTRSDDDEQEGSPGLREDAAPLVFGLLKISRWCRFQHRLLYRRLPATTCRATGIMKWSLFHGKKSVRWPSRAQR